MGWKLGAKRKREGEGVSMMRKKKKRGAGSDLTWRAVRLTLLAIFRAKKLNTCLAGGGSYLASYLV